MSELIEAELDSVESSVKSIELYHEIFRRVNAKPERISKRTQKSLQININDLKELHYKTVQTIQSLSPPNNLVVNIAASHLEGESERFASFEGFESYNLTSPRPTLDVTMSYRFSIYDDSTNKFENFEIEFLIRSRIAEIRQAEVEAPSFIPKNFILNILTPSARISVSHENYVKARAFLAMFGEWVDGCFEAKEAWWKTFIKKKSHWVSSVGRAIAVMLIALFTAQGLDDAVLDSNNTAKFLVVYASSFLVVMGLLNHFLVRVEQSIDSRILLSYINLNKGDQKIIREYESHNRNGLIRIIVNSGLYLIGVLSTSAIYDLVKFLFLKSA